MEEDKKKRSPRKSPEKRSLPSISVSPPSPTSPTTPSPTKRRPLTIVRLSQEMKSPSVERSPKRKLEKENSPVSPESSGSQTSFMTPKKLKYEKDIASTSEKSESTSSKQLKIEDRPLTTEKDEETSSEESLIDSQAEESEVEDTVPLRPNLADQRYLLAQKAKRMAYLKGLDYGLIPEQTFNKLNKIWFDYSMPDDIEKYYECMKKDSEKKTKDCERCNKDMYEKLVELYKLEPEKNIPVQGYMRRDIASCPYPLQSSCDCLVACIKCDVLYCKERDYEGNTVSDIIKDPYLEWQGVFDRATSDKDLPDLLNLDGTVYKEYEDRNEIEKKKITRYMIREMYREHEFICDIRQTTAEERRQKYHTDLERIVKENLIDYRFNRSKPCKYDHITCKYSSDRNRTLLGFGCIPKYTSKKENPNFNKKLRGKWEPY